MPESPKVLTVYECECGTRMLATGEEEEYGPPECNHGLFFGSTPDGGGEAEMEPVPYVPQAESVDRGVAEHLAAAVERHRFRMHKHYELVPGADDNELYAALHTYRQSVPEREETKQ